MKFVLFFFCIISTSAFANIDGAFYSEFKRNNMDCAIEANIVQKDVNQITFKQWDELCEDQSGNSLESSLDSTMTYEKIGDKKLKVTQGNDFVVLTAKILDFQKDRIQYDFEVDTDDGRLEINESFFLHENLLTFSSLYILDGQVIINKSGTIERQK